MSLRNFAVLPILSFAFVASSVYSSPEDLVAPSTEQVEEVETLETEEVNPTPEEEQARETTLEEPQTSPYIVESRGSIHYTQDEVRLYPVMESICTCESGRQFKQDGTVVRGIVNPQDIGMCQINLKYHGATAESLGYDLFTEKGNILYTNYLYDTQGAQPWYLSRQCHGIG